MSHSFEAIAAFRYGYGFAPGEPDVEGVDSLLAQVSGPDQGLALHQGPDFATRLDLSRQYVKLKRQIKKGDESVKPLLRRNNQTRNRLKADDNRNVFLRAAYSGQGFRERLVQFWADHFTVVPKSRGGQVIWGNYQEAAIRPHVGGHFADLLVAAVTHPSMTLFLDQVKSVGPKSPVGRKKKKRRFGLNENLAREVLELHTLGVGGSYSQTDVRQLAELLTGLVVGPDGTAFNVEQAEPGAETVLGKTYGGDPARLDDIKVLLRDLAVHPDTANHIARKLAVHFVSDTPDQDMVQRMARTFLRTDGHLPSVYGTMLDHPSAWGPLGEKARQPFDFMVAAIRALDIPQGKLARLKPKQVNRFLVLPLTAMGQPMRRAPGPNGWPEEAEAWITAQGVAARLQWSLAMTQRLDRDIDPRGFVDTALRDLAGQTLRFAVAGAERRAEGLTLVLASPEFNRR